MASTRAIVAASDDEAPNIEARMSTRSGLTDAPTIGNVARALWRMSGQSGSLRLCS